MFKILLAGMAVLGLVACSVSKPAAQQISASLPAATVCSQAGPLPLDWKIVKGVVLKKPADGRKLPVRYDIYTVDAKQADAFFKNIQAQKGGKIILPLPADLGCHSFSLSPSATLNAALAAKYPKLVSLKGAGEQENGNIVRIDYDGEQINAQVTLSNYKVVVIQPWPEDDKLYYLVYRAEDTGYERVPFEKPGTGGYKK